jgi:hypothetical protein
MRFVQRALVAVCAAGLLAAMGGVLPASAAIRNNNHWAGYVALPKAGGIATNFNSAQATFAVPALNCTKTPNAQAYQLAGIGGWNQTEFQATGVVEQCSGGTASYYAAIWYYGSCYPCSEQGPVQVPLTVSAGDSVRVDSYYNSAKQQGNFTIADITTGSYYEQPQTNIFWSSYPSAEVVSYGNIASQGTADFGQVAFTHAQVIDTSQHYYQKLQSTAFKTLAVQQLGPVTGLPDIKPGPLTSTGTGKGSSSSFINTWKRLN